MNFSKCHHICWKERKKLFKNTTIKTYFLEFDNFIWIGIQTYGFLNILLSINVFNTCSNIPYLFWIKRDTHFFFIHTISFVLNERKKGNKMLMWVCIVHLLSISLRSTLTFIIGFLPYSLSFSNFYFFSWKITLLIFQSSCKYICMYL